MPIVNNLVKYLASIMMLLSLFCACSVNPRSGINHSTEHISKSSNNTSDGFTESQTDTTQTENKTQRQKEPIVPRIGHVSSWNLNPEKSKLTPFTSYYPNPDQEEYKDKDGTEYTFDKHTGKLIAFQKRGKSTFEAKQKYTVTEMKAAADAIASNFVDISLYEKQEYEEDSGTHIFSYMRVVQGFDSAEWGQVKFQNEGVVDFVVFHNVGLFDKVRVPLIEKSALDSRFHTMVQQTMSNEVKPTDIYCVLNCKGGYVYMYYSFSYKNTQGNAVAGHMEVPLD